MYKTDLADICPHKNTRAKFCDFTVRNQEFREERTQKHRRRSIDCLCKEGRCR